MWCLFVLACLLLLSPRAIAVSAETNAVCDETDAEPKKEQKILEEDCDVADQTKCTSGFCGAITLKCVPEEVADSEQQVKDIFSQSKGLEAIAEIVQKLAKDKISAKGAELAAKAATKQKKKKRNTIASGINPKRLKFQTERMKFQKRILKTIEEEQYFAGLGGTCYPQSPECPPGAISKTSSVFTGGYEYCECSDEKLMMEADARSRCRSQTKSFFKVSDAEDNTGCICYGNGIQSGAFECAKTEQFHNSLVDLVCEDKLCKIALDNTCDIKHQSQCSTGFCGRISRKCVSGGDAKSEQKFKSMSVNIKDKAQAAKLEEALAQGKITSKVAELAASAAISAQVSELADAELIKETFGTF